jgi:hypothetical protein
MTPEQEKDLDAAILTILDERDSKFGLSANAVGVALPRFGFSVTHAEVERRLDYLADPQVGFAREVPTGDFHANLRAWRLTPRGLNHIRGR